MTGTVAARHSRTITGALALGFACYLALWATLLHVDGRFTPIVLASASTVLFLGLLVLLSRVAVAPGALAWAVVLGAVALQVVALTAAARTSDDVYRYIWDGRVQFAGIDPYRYAPSSPHLAHLRDSLLFGPRSLCTHPFPGGCTAINRPTVHTVYPPVAQGGFDVVRALSFGGHGGVRPFQIAGALGVVAIAVLLARWVLHRGLPVWSIALWAWSPVAVSEFGNNAHIDWLATLLSFGALVCTARGRVAWAGVLLGGAVLTKLYPALLLPALLRRRPVVLVGAAVALGVLSYLPHVLAVGAGVVGYLPGYLHEEGYSSGSRLLLIGAVVPHPYDTVLGVLVLAVVAVWCWRRSDPDEPERAAVTMAGAVFLVTTPAFGWYAALLLLLVAMTRRIAWLPVALAPTFAYLVDILHTPEWAAQIVYLVAAVAAAGLALALRRTAPTVRPGDRTGGQRADAA